jgi:hypothetical protein
VRLLLLVSRRCNSSGSGGSIAIKLLLGGFAAWFLRKVRMGIDESAETGVCLGIWYLPGESAQKHTHEYDGNTPYVSFAGVVRIVTENFWGKVRVAAHYAGGRCMCLARIMENGGGTKVDQLDDVGRRHDTVVELEIPVSKA